MTRQLERLTHEAETQLDYCARVHPVGSVESLLCVCTIRTSIRGYWSKGPDWPKPHFKWLAPEMYEEQ